MVNVISEYLDLLDSQREAAFAALEGLSDSQLWQRPAPREWSIGEILDHNYLLFASVYPVLRWMWKLQWYARLRRLHTDIRKFYEDKEEDLLGNLYLYDPFFGWCNLIVTLRIGIYHDQLHYDDVIRQAEGFRK